MTRKDFTKFAAMLGTARYVQSQGMNPLDVIEAKLIQIQRESNPRFNEKQFRDAVKQAYRDAEKFVSVMSDEEWDARHPDVLTEQVKK